jgi:hypothetical protein
MSERPEPEPIDTVKDGYSETQPASPEDVERAREHEDVLASSPTRDSDRSLTGESHPRPSTDADDQDAGAGEGT